MGRRHNKTFMYILEKPNRKDIDWNDFINLLLFLGASVEEQRGSAYGIKLNGEYLVLHKPHPVIRFIRLNSKEFEIILSVLV